METSESFKTDAQENSINNEDISQIVIQENKLVHERKKNKKKKK